MAKPKIRLDELVELVESRCFRVTLAPMFDDHAFLEARLKSVIFDLFKELHIADRFIRPGYVPAFNITFSPIDGSANILFKDEDIEFLFSKPTDMQQQFIDLQKKMDDAIRVPKSVLGGEPNEPTKNELRAIGRTMRESIQKEK